jgi:hypothetical protein
VVEGKGEARAQLAQAFYNNAVCGEDAPHPAVAPHAMIALAEAFGTSMSAEQFVADVRAALHALGAGDAMNAVDLPDEGRILEVIEEYRRRYDT